MPTRQFVILSREELPAGEGLAPLGTRAEILEGLAIHNTAPETEGDDILYGPGVRIEMNPGEDPVLQMLLTITEEEIGWLVLDRLRHALGWRVLDPVSGRTI